MRTRLTLLFVLLLMSGCQPQGVCGIDRPYECLEPGGGGDGGSVPNAGPPGLQCPDEVTTAMGQQIDFAGTWTAPNPVSKVPPGAADVALNVVSDRQGLAECMAGQGPIGGDYFTTSEHLLSGTTFGPYAFEHTGLALYRRVLGSTPVVISSDMPASPAGRMRFVPAGDDLYILTATGPKMIDSGEGAPRVPGAPMPLDLPPDTGNSTVPSTPPTNVPVFLKDGFQVAYRAVFSRQDIEGRPILGAPSSRVVYANKTGDGSTRAVVVDVNIPPGTVAGDHIQLYRTTQIEVSTDPGDTMYQVAEVVVAAGNISLGYREIIDGTPDELVGPALYTNQGQQGAGLANNRPPFARVAESYRDHLFLGDITYHHVLSLRMIGVPSNTTTVTYTYAGGSGSFAYDSSHAYTRGGTYPSGATVSQKVEMWSLALVGTINLTSYSTGLSAHYISGPNDPPGMIRLEWSDSSDSPITFSTSAEPGVFVPELTSPISSTREANLNEVTFSREGLPYAFPIDTSYHLRLGRADMPILGMLKNRDSLFVFKQDGIWRIYPGGDTFSVQQMTTDIALQFPDSLAVVDNQILGFFNRGIMAVSETGIEEVDGPIKNVVDAIRGINLATALQQPGVFAVADPTRLRYYLWYPETTAGGVATHARVYNGRTDTWTERDDAATGGYTGRNGLIYLGLATAPRITEQRNTGTASDFQGPAGQPIPVRIDWKGLTNQNPGGVSFYREVRALFEKPTTGAYHFDFTNDYNVVDGTDAVADGGKFVTAAVPDGHMRTSYLGVSMKRDVLNEYLVVLGLRDVSDNYDGPVGR